MQHLLTCTPGKVVGSCDQMLQGSVTHSCIYLYHLDEKRSSEMIVQHHAYSIFIPYLSLSVFRLKRAWLTLQSREGQRLAANDVSLWAAARSQGEPPGSGLVPFLLYYILSVGGCAFHTCRAFSSVLPE